MMLCTCDRYIQYGRKALGVQENLSRRREQLEFQVRPRKLQTKKLAR